MADFIEADVDDELLQEIVVQTSFEKMKEGKLEGEIKEFKKYPGYFDEGYSMYRKGKTKITCTSAQLTRHMKLIFQVLTMGSFFFRQTLSIIFIFNFGDFKSVHLRHIDHIN